jgi:hypothetical protein
VPSKAIGLSNNNKRETKMKKFLMLTAVVSVIASPSFGSEVYIDQAGNATNVNILQQNGNNRINTDAAPMIVNGDDINVELVQDGDGNVAEIYIQVSANDTNYEYRVEGDLNEILSNINGGVDNNFVAAVIGNDNTITLCKNYINSTCNGIQVNMTDTTLNLTGNNNEINFALDGAEATNIFNVGQTTPSDFNVINLTQTTSTGHIVHVDIDGDTNTVDIVQH